MEEIASQLHEIAYAIGKVVYCIWFFFAVYCMNSLISAVVRFLS